MATAVVRPNGPARRVLEQLRHGPRTVEEVAKALRISDNAVRNQLAKLEGVKLVSRTGTRPGISKPSRLYALTLNGQIQFSTLYLPVLMQFMRVAEGRCSTRQLTTFMSDTGKSLAANFPHPRGSLNQRVQAAARLLRGFGGAVEVRGTGETPVIRSNGCPLAALTSERGDACKVIEGLIAEYVSAQVTTCCTLGEDPHCCFEVRS